LVHIAGRNGILGGGFCHSKGRMVGGNRWPNHKDQFLADSKYNIKVSPQNRDQDLTVIFGISTGS
jgi:hypothetical protein